MKLTVVVVSGGGGGGEDSDATGVSATTVVSVVPQVDVVASPDRSEVDVAVVADATGSSTDPVLVSMIGLLNDSRACRNSASVMPVVVSAAGTNDGASITSMTSTGRLAVATASVPVKLSWAVAVILSAKSSLESGAGVSVKPVSWSAVKVQEPSEFCVPAESAAPSGKPSIATDSVVVGDTPTSPAVMVSGMAVSSSPDAVATDSVGASSTSVTLTGSAAVVTASAPVRLS